MGISKKMRKGILSAIAVFVLVLAGGIGSFYMYVRHNIYNGTKGPEHIVKDYNEYFPLPEPEEERQKYEESGKVEYSEQNGVTNILLIGTDARDLNENSRADSIIIATIDANSKKLKFTSIMRDTYVTIPKHSPQKINAAYAYGGPQLLMDTIEKNFRVKLDKYIIINFGGFENVIDGLGGIDINIKDYEIKEMNKFIGEIRSFKSPPITQSGLQHLDGQQVLAYSRIRKVGNGSYERNQRQRTVLTLLAQKLMDISVFQYPSMLSKILPCIKTNIEPVSFFNYAYTVSKFKPLQVRQLQMPVTELSEGRIYKGTWVFLMDKEQNAKVLSDFIFRDKAARPDEFNMKSFRSKIDEYLINEKKINH